jgi:hypothetical protein
MKFIRNYKRFTWSEELIEAILTFDSDEWTFVEMFNEFGKSVAQMKEYACLVITSFSEIKPLDKNNLLMYNENIKDL